MLLAGGTLFAVGGLFHLVVPFAFPAIPLQFDNVALFRPWAGWTSIYMAVHPFGFGVVFAGVFLGLRARGGLPPGWWGGLVYGLGVFLVGSLPVYLLAFAAFQVAPAVIAVWVAQSACQYLAAGVALGWFTRQAGQG